MVNRISLLLLGLLLVPLGSVQANLRAPVRLPVGPSSALAPAASQVLVTAERLTFACGGDCAVTAEYFLHAAAALDLSLEFLLLSPEPVTVWSGRAEAPVAVAPAEPLAPDSAWSSLAVSGRDRPYRARFHVRLDPGPNRLTLNYRQPLGATEHGHSYWRSGRYLHHFGYLVGPLKEWRLAPEFRLHLRVATPEENGWARLFGPRQSVHLRAMDQAGRPLDLDQPPRLTRTRREIVLTAALAQPLPDYLEIFLGDQDLVDLVRPKGGQGR